MGPPFDFSFNFLYFSLFFLYFLYISYIYTTTYTYIPQTAFRCRGSGGLMSEPDWENRARKVNRARLALGNPCKNWCSRNMASKKFHSVLFFTGQSGCTTFWFRSFWWPLSHETLFVLCYLQQKSQNRWPLSHVWRFRIFWFRFCSPLWRPKNDDPSQLKSSFLISNFCIFLMFDFLEFSDVSANSLDFDWSTSFWIDFLMTSERLLFETPLSRNRRFCKMNRFDF